MPTLTADYDDRARVRLEADDLLPGVVYAIRRSTDGGTTWATVRGATNIVDGGVTVVYDYEYAPSVENRYELTQPIVSDTFERNSGAGHLAAAADEDVSDPSVAPSIDAPAAGLLVSAWTTGHEYNGPYTLPVSMSPVTQQSGIRVTNAVATEAVSAGATGTRAATAGTPSSWSAVSAVAVGPAVAVEDAVWGMSTDDAPGEGVSVTTGAADVGWWLVAVYATDWDGSDEMQAPLGGGWELLAASLPLGTSGQFLVSRTTVWAKEVTAAGPQTVEVADTPSSEDNFLTVLVLSGVDTAPLGWGSADTGQPWLEYTNSGAGVVWSVADGAGRLTVPEGAPPAPFNWGRYLPVDVTDVEVQYDLIMPAGGAGATWQWRLAIRGTDESFTGYELILSAEDSGTVELAAVTSDSPVTDIDVGTWQVGQRWRVKARVVGTVIEARAWNTANREPSTWQLVKTSTARASGTVGINFNVGDDTGAMFLVDNVMVRGVPPLVVATATVTPDQPDVWLKSPTHPSLNVNLGCIATTARTRRSRVALYDVKGQSAPVGIADVGSTEAFTIIFDTHSPEENMAVAGLITFGAPLLLQSPPDADPEGCGNLAAYPSGWFMPGDNTEARPLPGKRVWEWQIPLTRVKAPSPQGVTPAHMTWSVLWQMVENWVELWDAWATWAELWNAQVAPEVMYRALSGGDL